MMRFMFAFFCGYFISVSGSLSQLVTNNSLASPSTLGMDGAAVLFILVSQIILVVFNIDFSLNHLSLILFAGTSLVLFPFVFYKSKVKNIWHQLNMQKVILFGLAFNLMIGALFSVIQFLFMALNFEFPVGLWFGSFKQYDQNFIFIFIIVFMVTQLVLYRLSPKIEVLNLGSSIAQGMGFDVEFIQKFGLYISFILTGIVISYFGVFSFLGLIFPHILRSFRFFKRNMKFEILLGPYFCGAILGVVDQLCYNVTVHGAELPVGMVSSVIGAFVLILLVFKLNLSRT
jgi:iron complex transport system permease protein